MVADTTYSPLECGMSVLHSSRFMVGRAQHHRWHYCPASLLMSMQTHAADCASISCSRHIQHARPSAWVATQLSYLPCIHPRLRCACHRTFPAVYANSSLASSCATGHWIFAFRGGRTTAAHGGAALCHDCQAAMWSNGADCLREQGCTLDMHPFGRPTSALPYGCLHLFACHIRLHRDLF